MTSTCASYRRLLAVCWFSLFVAWPQVLPIGSTQEQPLQPQQAEQPAAIKDGVAAEVMKDAAVAIVVEDEEVVDLVGMRARAQNPQMWLLNGYVRVNCALARRACNLSEEEEQKLSQLDSAWVDKQLKESIASPVKEVAAGIARFLGGRAVAEVININGNQGDPQQVLIPKVKNRIDTAIEESLELDHKEAFQRERESRDQFRKQAMASVLVSVLDERVFLTQQQRDDLEPEVEKWLTKDLYWQFYFQNTNFVPDIPKRMLSQVLSAEQLEALEGVRAWNYEASQIEMQMMQEEPVMIER
ncbi:MAG: hypothetical protein R3C09_25460 [Pirellulaceae bacterium]